MARATVAVVGGGCAGVLVSRELLRNGDDDVVLIEPGEPGGGLAYGSARPWHLLNSRAGAMSADPSDPGHFVRWARSRGMATDPDDFLSRRDYGRYLREALDEAAAEHPGRLTVRSARVTAVAPEWTVTLDDGTRVRADDVVLAVGNPRGAQPSAIAAGHPGYIADPWVPGVLDAIPGDAPVLLIGTGLTAVDVALTLTVGKARTAPITALSRRGRLPLGHTVKAVTPAVPFLDNCTTLRDVIRAVRASADEVGDWRAVVDGMRPYLDELWSGLTPVEQEAFLRHLARPWECHRHRMAPLVAQCIETMIEDGSLLVSSGGIRPETDLSGYPTVINCAGPGKLPGSANPLVASMLAAGLVRVGPHDLGLDIDAAGRLLTADGRPQQGLWLVGPLRRGVRWETTAVPEIRAQAHRLSTDMTAGELLEAA
jgi:uncharacterized NAD(P)/FAD-binding protein YdhS